MYLPKPIYLRKFKLLYLKNVYTVWWLTNSSGFQTRVISEIDLMITYILASTQKNCAYWHQPTLLVHIKNKKIKQIHFLVISICFDIFVGQYIWYNIKLLWNLHFFSRIFLNLLIISLTYIIISKTDIKMCNVLKTE